MKKFFLIGLLALLGMTQAAAQEYEYVPFVREGVKWICSYYYTPQSHFILELKGDAVIDGNIYKAMHYYSDEGINMENDTVPIYLREENKVVYGIVPNGKTYAECPIGLNQDAETQEKIAAGEEFVLYNFNDALGFIGQWNTIPFLTRTVIPDMTTVGDRQAKRYISKYDDEFCAIEGIGYDGIYSSWYTLGNRGNYVLNWVIEDGDTIYRSERYKDVRPGRLSTDLLPMAREGVQWVNERVIINHGDTTRCYYTYEFNGTNSRNYPICYSYNGESFDPNQAQAVAIFQAEYDHAKFTNYILNDVPYSNIVEQGRDMITYGGTGWPIYQFACTGSDIEMTNPVNYYIISQKEDFLTRENFVEVEPVWIEGYRCRRYAYYGDGDEPLCYVVEGIGFDSRDMGDLLTPFTRQPDPDADYQEYWGLSHVIKDGKIIYKGMCYNNYAPGIPGDVNDDMVVNITDVTAIIDFLLRSFHVTIESYDVNRDGFVSIADVTSLVEILLANDESSINLHDKSNNPTRDVDDQPYVFYKNDIHRVIIYGKKAVDYYDVVITSVATGASMISTWVDGTYGTIDVSTFPAGKYRITIDTPACGTFEGYFDVL